MAENRLSEQGLGRDSTRIEDQDPLDLSQPNQNETASRRFQTRLFNESWSRDWNTSRLTLMARNPNSLFVYWEVRASWKALVAAHFQSNWNALPFSLRLHDVTDVVFDGRNSHHHLLVSPSRSVDNWYFHEVQPDRNYVVDFGTWTEEGQFFAILRSNVVRTPRVTCSSKMEIRYAQPGARASPRLESLPHLEPSPQTPKNFGIPAYANEFDGYGALTADVRRDEEGE